MTDQVQVNAATGRPVRKGAGKREANPNYVDTVSAIKDPMGDMMEENKAILSIAKGKRGQKRKRLRSPSPPPPPLSPIDCVTESDLATLENTPAPEVPAEPEYAPITLTFNIAAGFQGPLKIQLDPSHLIRMATSVSVEQSRLLPAPKAKRQRLSKDLEPPPQPLAPKPSKSYRQWTKKYGKPPCGFLDLPPELRNTVYRMVFVSDREIDFGSKNTKRSAAFLRVCRKVHEEATSILYGENRFVFKRNKNTRSPFWVSDPKEVGYLDMRHFLSMIGPVGRPYLRRIHVILEDATRSHAYNLWESDGRYTHDGNLLACFKIMAKDCFIKNLALTFYGRRQVSTFDVRFLENLCAIEVDELVVNPNQTWTGDKIESRVQELLRQEMVRPEALYDKDKKSKTVLKVNNMPSHARFALHW